VDSTDAAEVFLVPFQKELDSVARKHHLPVALLAAIVQEESQFNAFAVRTEPSYLKKKLVIRQARKWSRDHGGIPTYETELYLRATSMGLAQPMGEVAREQGFRARFLSELIMPFNSLDEGAKLLQSKLRKYKSDTLSAISAYNQGSNKKRRGVYLNARYVYRVTVAWRAYQHIFQSSNTSYNDTSYQTITGTHRQSRYFLTWHHRRSPIQPESDVRRPESGVEPQNRNRENCIAQTGLDERYCHDSTAARFTQSEAELSTSEARRRRASRDGGLGRLFRFGWVLQCIGLVIGLARYALSLS
jgi:hypothetical protein